MRKLFLCLSSFPLFFFAVQGQVQSEPSGPQVEYGELRPLPLDSRFVYGKLENGLTYYIRQNAQPEERAEFYLVQCTGSLQEEENQRGLAHTLEHIAFNGSEHFPGQEIDRYLERLGLKSGENLNAYTSFDETVFMIMNAPVEKEGVVDSCLLILRDISSGLSLDSSAIEQERAVIREEWRSGRDADARLRDIQFPVLLEGSKYAERLPIGRIEVIESFRPEELKAYYKKWYRPDMQAVIVVGDLNPEEVKVKIAALFGNIPAPSAAISRPKEPVPQRVRPAVVIAKDKEAQSYVVSLFYKHDKMSDFLYTTTEGVRRDYLQTVVATLLNERLDRMLYEPDPPFVFAQSSDGDYLSTRTRSAWALMAAAGEGRIDSALYALAREAERVKRFGFTSSEYERTKVNVLKYYENLYLERDNEESATYANACVFHFTSGGYMPAIELEYEVISFMSEAVTLDDVNKYARAILEQRDVVISVAGPEKDAPGIYPDEAALLTVFDRAGAGELEPYSEDDRVGQLLRDKPVPGGIVSEEADSLFHATVLTLSNGVRVVAKPTAFKENEIVITGSSPGGSTLFEKKDRTNLKALSDVVSLGGLGDYSVIDIDRALAGKNVYCSFSIDKDSESVGGYSSVSDLRTFFELVYLYFTAPRRDEAAYLSFVARSMSMLKTVDLNPMVAFGDSLGTALYGDKPEVKRITEAELRQLDYERIMGMYKERFADASDFVFTVVGNFDMDSVRLFAKEYLAALPSVNRVEAGDERALLPYRTGVFSNHFRKKMETPKSSVVHFFHSQSDYSLKSMLTANMLNQLLDLAYMEKVRKEEGGSYGVGVSVNVYSFPKGRTSLQIYYDTDPGKLEQINAVVLFELRRLADSPPREEEVANIRENLNKTYKENQTSNVYWLSLIDNYYFSAFDSYTSYLKTLNSITAEDIRAFASGILSGGNHIEIIMSPEE